MSKETTIWIVWCPGQAGPSVIESYGPGQAVEHFLSNHGMFGYDEIKMIEADGIDLIDTVESYIPKSDCEELDKHHKPTIIKELP